MSNPNPAPISNSFLEGVASGAIPGAASTTSNHAGGFPISGGNGGGITGSASIDDNLKSSLDSAFVLPSLAGAFPRFQGALEGNALDFVDKSTLLAIKGSDNNFFATGQKNPLALVSGCGIANSTVGIGKGLGLPSPQGQGQTQGG